MLSYAMLSPPQLKKHNRGPGSLPLGGEKPTHQRGQSWQSNKIACHGFFKLPFMLVLNLSVIEPNQPCYHQEPQINTPGIGEDAKHKMRLTGIKINFAYTTPRQIRYNF
jgi:hypothetical protein